MVNKSFLLNSMNVFHIAVSLFPMLAFFTNDKTILNLIWMYFLILYLGWFIFLGKCWLSILEKKLIKSEEKNDKKYTSITSYYIEKYLKTDPTNFIKSCKIIYFIYIYACIYVVTKKLGILDKGLGLILYSLILYNLKLDIYKQRD